MLSSVLLFFSSSSTQSLHVSFSAPYSAAIHLNNAGTRATMESHYKRSVAYRFTIAPGPDTQNILFPNPHARTTEFIILGHRHCFAKLNVYLDTLGKLNVPFRVHSPGVIRFQHPRPQTFIYVEGRSSPLIPRICSRIFNLFHRSSIFQIRFLYPLTRYLQFSHLVRFLFWDLE